MANNSFWCGGNINSNTKVGQKKVKEGHENSPISAEIQGVFLLANLNRDDSSVRILCAQATSIYQKSIKKCNVLSLSTSLPMMTTLLRTENGSQHTLLLGMKEQAGDPPQSALWHNNN